MRPHRLDGTTAIVTGAGRGIGRAIAARFVEEGARVLLFDRDRKAVEDAADEYGDHTQAQVGSIAEERGIDRSRLAVDTMNCALVADSTPLAARSSLSIHELQHIPFLFPDRSFQPELYDMLFGQFERLGFLPRVDDTYGGLRTIWQLVASGHGWAMGFASQCDDPPPGTRAVTIDELSIPWGLDLLLREDESRALILDVAARLHGIGRATEQ